MVATACLANNHFHPSPLCPFFLYDTCEIFVCDDPHTLLKPPFPLKTWLNLWTFPFRISGLPQKSWSPRIAQKLNLCFSFAISSLITSSTNLFRTLKTLLSLISTIDYHDDKTKPIQTRTRTLMQYCECKSATRVLILSAIVWANKISHVCPHRIQQTCLDTFLGFTSHYLRAWYTIWLKQLFMK